MNLEILKDRFDLEVSDNFLMKYLNRFLNKGNIVDKNNSFEKIDSIEMVMEEVLKLVVLFVRLVFLSLN